VIFVGTGPGDPDLLTLGAIAALADASAVILDTDRQREVLAHPAITVSADAEVATLGLTEAGRPLTPAARAKIVLKHAASGARVVRLVSGDPFLDNAVADEAAACVRGGIDFEVVPGVSSLTAVPEYAGIDLNHGGGVHFASVTDGRFTKAATHQWGNASTVVVSTLVSMVGDLVDAALAAGRPGDDHALVTFHGGSTEQISLPANLLDLVSVVRAAKVPAEDPVHVIMGQAVEQRDELSWYETKPLFGWRVLVPRTKDQAAPMVARLRTYGAHSEEVPTISVEPPRSPLQMDKAIRGLVEGRYEWVAFTSVNAVKAVREKLEDFGLDARAFAGVKVAAVGDATAKLMLAHTAEAQGIVAAETIAGAETMPIDYDFIPRATYCQPQIASFGYTEEQAKARGHEVKVSKFPFAANAKAHGLGEAIGFVKLVADAEHNEILGAHLIGPQSSNLIQPLIHAMSFGQTAYDVARGQYWIHPALSEVVENVLLGLVTDAVSTATPG